MASKDWSKYKTGGTQTGQTPIGTLQPQGKKDWSKYKTVSREEPEKIAGVDIHYTKTGHIDTRYFFKTPNWVLKFNKSIDDKITTQFQKEPASLLMRVMDTFTRLHPYEALRNMQVDPEKYPTILSKLGHYIETIKEPKVSPALRGYGQLMKGFQRGFEESRGAWGKIFPSLVSKAKFEQTVEKRGLPLGAFKVGEKVIDPTELVGFFADVYGEPTGFALAGIGKLAKAPLFPLVSKAKETISEVMVKGFKKNLVAKVMTETGVDAFNKIFKRVGNWGEASTIYLDQYGREGWQDLLIKTTADKLPKGLSIIDYLTQKFSKVPYEVRTIKKLTRNLERGYENVITKNFRSIFKGFKITDDSLDMQMITKYIDFADEVVEMKTGVQKTIMQKTLKDMAKDLTPIQKQGIDYLKKLGNWEEFIETNKAFGYELEYGHTQNYLLNKYLHTGKKTAYLFPKLKKRFDVTKPYFTFERQMTAKEAIKEGYKFATPFDRIETRIGLHAKAINYRSYLNSVVDMFGETAKKEGYRLVNIKPKKFVKPLLEKYLPDTVASFLEKGDEVIELGSSMKKILKVMSPITRAYKTVWTYSTGFVARNLVGSHKQNWVYGFDALNLKKQGLVARLSWSADDFDFMLHGKKVNSKLFREVFDLSGMGAGWTRGELGHLAGKVGGAVRKLSEGVERDARMFAMYSALNQGDSLAKSMITTKLLHFDYLDGLTQAEKIYGRTAIPFFSWYRFNTPLQLRFMIENPQRVSTVFKVWRSLGVGTPEETPEWFDNYMMGKVGDLDLSKNIQKYLRLDLPISQIGLLQPSFEALTEDKDLPFNQRWLKLLSPFVSLTHPFVKSLFELTANFDTFRERPVFKKVVSPIPTFIIDALPEFSKNWLGAEAKVSKSGFKVYRIDGWKAKILENLIPLYQFNILSGYSKYEGYEEQKLALDKLSMLTGVKIYPVSLDYLQGKYKKPIKIIPIKKTDWSKYKTERGK